MWYNKNITHYTKCTKEAPRSPMTLWTSTATTTSVRGTTIASEADTITVKFGHWSNVYSVPMHDANLQVSYCRENHISGWSLWWCGSLGSAGKKQLQVWLNSPLSSPPYRETIKKRTPQSSRASRKPHLFSQLPLCTIWAISKSTITNFTVESPWRIWSLPHLVSMMLP